MNLVEGLLLLCSFVAGMLGGVAVTWRLHVRTYRLEDQVSLLEGITQREVKARAGMTRLQKPDKDAALMATLAGTAPARKPNWWEVLPKDGSKVG